MEKHNVDMNPKHPSSSPDMDRNPSPPSSDDEEASPEDTIANTVFSKHWFFSTLTKLIETITEKEKAEADKETWDDLDEDMENDICKVWDMSMNEEVALFLMEFNAPEILLGAITRSKCSRLTEICIGILGNMACFQETCQVISSNEALGEVLLLLLCDTDPPTLLETTRLLLTCVFHAEVMSTWLERIKKRSTVRDNLCFIMSSSTNGDLLVKVGELVDKLFDVDEDLMIDWIKPGCKEPETPANDTEEDKPAVLGLIPSLLEAAKQLRHESPEGLDVYMHVLQLVTTVDEGILSLVQSPEDGKATWEFLYDLMCQDLCQPADPPLIVQEQKFILSSVLAVMSVMFTSQTGQEYTEIQNNLSLVGSLTQILDNLEICQRKSSNKPQDQDEAEDKGTEEDFHLNILKEVCCEFLSNIMSQLTKEIILEGLKLEHISEDKCLTAIRNLLPQYAASVKSFIVVLGEANESLTEALQKELSELIEES
ncbi:protein SAAL1 isoform X2 [Pseudophryne corroboree]|uniref:protein SAAL1 isoform X2 n=1 Tax=Pseudophryne corroboree TaxID=495146 RepID=UPI003081B175